MRKVAVKFGGRSTDIISQKGGKIKITTVNAKGSYSRKMMVGKGVSQRNVEGDMVTCTTWWDGQILKSRMEVRQHCACLHSLQCTSQSGLPTCLVIPVQLQALQLQASNPFIV